MENKNFIVFIILSMAIIMSWSIFFGPKPKPRPPHEVPAAGNTTTPGAGSTAIATGPGAGSTASPQPGATAGLKPGGTVAVTPGNTAAPALAAPPGPPVKTVKAVTDVFQVEFTTEGAAPIHWDLKKYPTEKCFPYRVDLKWPPLVKDPPCDTDPIEMVEPSFKAPELPFAAKISIDANEVPLKTVWELESADLTLDDGRTTGEIVFSTRLKSGPTLKKIYRFHQGRYDVDLDFTVAGGPAPTKTMVDVAMPFLYRPTSKVRVPRWNYNGAEVNNGRDVRQFKSDDVIKAKAPVTDTGLEWVGVTSDFFLTAVATGSDSRLASAVSYIGGATVKGQKNANKPMLASATAGGLPELLAKGEVAKLRLFVGPKDKEVLSAVMPSLQYSIDYGYLKVLVIPLLWCLVHINRVTNNYGVAIIILTFILRMGMIPLMKKQQQSMKQMQKLQPEIKKIKDRYPDDRLKQNEAMQELWRKHKINPAMGCLPVVAQMPVFFAFYKALLISSELRQAPFAGWINDLSARDPLYIWPVLMAGTQVLMQKMTPSQMDPVQQKMFTLMPLLFMFMLRDFPSGLLIYWTVSNVVGIIQAYYFNQKIDAEQRT